MGRFDMFMLLLLQLPLLVMAFSLEFSSLEDRCSKPEFLSSDFNDSGRNGGAIACGDGDDDEVLDGSLRKLMMTAVVRDGAILAVTFSLRITFTFIKLFDEPRDNPNVHTTLLGIEWHGTNSDNESHGSNDLINRTPGGNCHVSRTKRKLQWMPSYCYDTLPSLGK